MPPGTLRQRLRGLVLRWLIVFIALASLAIGLASARFRRLAIDDRLLLARTIAHSIDARLELSFQIIEKGRLRSSESDIDSLHRARLGQPLFRDAAFLFDPAGNLVLADPPFADPPEIEIADTLEKVTSVLQTTSGRAALAMVAPIARESGRWTVVLLASLRGSPLSQMLQELGAEPGLDLTIVDVDGTVIAAADGHRLLVKLPDPELLHRRLSAKRVAEESMVGLTGPTQEDGQSRGNLRVMVPLRLAPWGVVVEQDREQAFAAVYAFRAAGIGSLCLIAVMGLLLGRNLGHTVVDPIQNLSEQAALLQKGELHRPIKIEGDREIEVLAGALDQARRHLARQMGELESEVADRTRRVDDLLKETLRQDRQRRDLVRRLLSAGEAERRRIARELHDELAQLLTVVQLGVEGLKCDAPTRNQLVELIRLAQAEVHRIIHDLRPSVLDDLGLAAALRQQAEQGFAAANIKLTLEIGDGGDLPDEIETAVFRIGQEILSNVRRHAAAEHLGVELFRDGNRLQLTIEDDGRGFDPELTSGTGITGMRERAELVGAQLAIESEPGEGTQVQLLLELPQ